MDSVLNNVYRPHLDLLQRTTLHEWKIWLIPIDKSREISSHPLHIFLSIVNDYDYPLVSKNDLNLIAIF